MADMIKAPEHYEGNGITCMQAMDSMMSNAPKTFSASTMYWWGCVFKYLWRWPKKGKITDLQKAQRCLEYLIDYAMKDAMESAREKRKKEMLNVDNQRYIADLGKHSESGETDTNVINTNTCDEVFGDDTSKLKLKKKVTQLRKEKEDLRRQTMEYHEAYLFAKNLERRVKESYVLDLWGTCYVPKDWYNALKGQVRQLEDELRSLCTLIQGVLDSFEAKNDMDAMSRLQNPRSDEVNSDERVIFDHRNVTCSDIEMLEE